MNQKTPAIYCSDYTALIIRKTYKELSDLIRTSFTLYPNIDPKSSFNKSKNVWTFSSGAQLIFSNCPTDNDVYQYQGLNIQYVGLEEIGQFETNFVYQYLKSRLRTTNPNIKCYMRATANPSKYPWLREYFGINSIGDSSVRYETITTSNGVVKKRKIEFISARLSDNPHLYKNGEYETMLMSLPAEERDALLYGMWNAYSVKGSIYSDLLAEARKEHRICSIKKEQSSDIFVVFDLGWNDQTAIIFAQFVGKEIRIFDHIEDRQQDIDYYFGAIKQKVGNGNDVFIILPHDARAKSLQTGRSIEEKALTIFKNVEVLSRENIETGITLAKEMMKNVWIEKSLERFITCLESYRRKHNPTTNLYEAPIHDEYSNTADAFRYLAMCKPKQNINLLKIQPQMMNLCPW